MKKLFYVIISLLLIACGDGSNAIVDNVGDRAYRYHYRNLDSIEVIARKQLAIASHYSRGRAEAYNHLAFVSISRMDYVLAEQQLDSALNASADDVEQAVAYVQMMRICQRQSRNKDFYLYRYKAKHCISMAQKYQMRLGQHRLARLVYAETELAIVESAYCYYVGLTKQSQKALSKIDPGGAIVKDTAQLLSYYYNVGSGGIVVADNEETLRQQEFDMLLRCYLLSRQMKYDYWEANAMQALSEHLQSATDREMLAADNPKEIDFINTDNTPLDSLPTNLARRALATFMAYGDVYQTAGALRTLAECRWAEGNYDEALSCLNLSLSRDTTILQAPDLVASIYEQLSLTYSALDNKSQSDHFRNQYLDAQEQTRQDRQLEARADQLSHSVAVLKTLISICVGVLVIVMVAFLCLVFRRQRKSRELQLVEDKITETTELTLMAERDRLNNKQRNLEQRAKVSMVVEIMPLVNRITHELDQLVERDESEEVKHERVAYVAELAQKICEYNEVLTDWIQIRQGRLRMKVESFQLQQLFDIINGSSPDLAREGIRLSVKGFDTTVKADRTLTLFMINTLIDNARRFTHSGGNIQVEANEGDGFVEIVVSDDGEGMTEEKLQTLFNAESRMQLREPLEAKENKSESGHHGFGLVNCKGIIEHYRKMSHLFSVCDIKAESELGKGTRIAFRLPKGVRHAIALLLLTQSGVSATASTPAAYADSTIACNLQGRYSDVFLYADSCIMSLNNIYFATHPQGTDVMVLANFPDAENAELEWWRQGLDMDYHSILIMRNELAVAALALHQWRDYTYNNKVYTQLFREVSADKNIQADVEHQSRLKQRRNLAIVLIVSLIVLSVPMCYFAYRRRKKLLQQALTDAENALLEETDRLKKAEMARDQYYINNSVMDNCLSTLKHETMFYPSRLLSLIEIGDVDAAQLRSLALYYKDIFTILSQMAAEQTIKERSAADRDMTAYLMELLAELGGDMKSIVWESAEGQYKVLRVPLPKMTYTDDVAARLFSPTTTDVRFIMLRQLVREMGETYGARACGIVATEENGYVALKITLTSRIFSLSRM